VLLKINILKKNTNLSTKKHPNYDESPKKLRQAQKKLRQTQKSLRQIEKFVVTVTTKLRLDYDQVTTRLRLSYDPTTT